MLVRVNIVHCAHGVTLYVLSKQRFGGVCSSSDDDPKKMEATHRYRSKDQTPRIRGNQQVYLGPLAGLQPNDV